jgi:hypothetical protein
MAGGIRKRERISHEINNEQGYSRKGARKTTSSRAYICEKDVVNTSGEKHKAGEIKGREKYYVNQGQLVRNEMLSKSDIIVA